MPPLVVVGYGDGAGSVMRVTEIIQTTFTAPTKTTMKLMLTGGDGNDSNNDEESHDHDVHSDGDGNVRGGGGRDGGGNDGNRGDVDFVINGGSNDGDWRH